MGQDKTERILSKEVLERIEAKKALGIYEAGNQVLIVSLNYVKNVRVRGYYLNVKTHRELDNGGILWEVFGDPRSKPVLIQETNAFSAKTLAGIVVAAETIEPLVAQVKAEYAVKRAKEQTEREEYAAEKKEERAGFRADLLDAAEGY